MTKLQRLVKYVEVIKDRLKDDLPKKHLDREKTYRQFLKNEIEFTQNQIDTLKLNGVTK